MIETPEQKYARAVEELRSVHEQIMAERTAEHEDRMANGTPDPLYAQSLSLYEDLYQEALVDIFDEYAVELGSATGGNG
ncbi:hypothetical protein [Hyphomicrobium methylovorum]|uniref:hypothetical protein n=1 Tax=Hyphomicrobium methylovorum TaxID=84 RepID=UPI0015E786D8|nr:hypothetical protein [Hyphomicrobium methylovorum]